MGRLCENCKCNSEIEVCADCDWRTKRYKIPKFATNGDVIKALFPNLKHTKIITNGVYECHIDHKRHSFDYSWWNAPYKSESEVK